MIHRTPLVARLTAVAAALAAVGVSAQTANVTLFGIVDTNVQRYSASGAASVSRVGTDGLSSSRWGMRGTESLGGGLAASFWLEGAFSGDTGGIGSTNTNNQSSGSATGLFGRRATVSLSGGFGELRLGRDLTPAFMNLSDFNLYGTNGTGNAGAMFYPIFSSQTHVRASNGISYLTPGNLGGLFVHATYAFGENAGNNDGRYASARVGYRNGPLSVAAGTARATYANGNQTQTNVGASYNFGVAKLNALWGVNKKDAAGTAKAVENSAFHVGVGVPLGAFEVRAGYTDARVKGGDGARQLMGGVMYNLSKRTTLYLDASQVDNKGAGKTFGVSDGLKPVTAGGKSTGFEAGIRHTF
ncbi:MAG: porin [Burkholderiales bacterium]|nr:porin [Burkholderiales bacterium]